MIKPLLIVNGNNILYENDDLRNLLIQCQVNFFIV